MWLVIETINEIETTIKNLPTKKTSSPDDSTGQSAKYLKEEIMPIRIEKRRSKKKTNRCGKI